MTEKRFYVAESNLIDGYCVFDREKEYAFHPRLRKADCLNDAHILNEVHDENKTLKEQLEECQIKKQKIKEVMLKGDVVVEQKELQKLIYLTVINLINEKIKKADERFGQTFDSRYQGQIDALKELKKELQ